MSSGIGAGLILNGRLYRGAAGLAGELGHVLVDPDGVVCRCGNRGCLETLAASGALVELLQRSHGTDVSAADMLRLAREGDLGCRRVIADAGRAIGRAIADLLNVLNPELVVVGGELAGAGDLLLDGVRESISRAALPAAAGSARLVAGVLGDRAQVLGAVALVVSEADRSTLLPESMSRPIRRRR
jgi:predicted NBD/HSP70 family sugar kinase